MFPPPLPFRTPKETVRAIMEFSLLKWALFSFLVFPAEQIACDRHSDAPLGPLRGVLGAHGTKGRSPSAATETADPGRPAAPVERALAPAWPPRAAAGADLGVRRREHHRRDGAPRGGSCGARLSARPPPSASATEGIHDGSGLRHFSRGSAVANGSCAVRFFGCPRLRRPLPPLGSTSQSTNARRALFDRPRCDL